MCVCVCVRVCVCVSGPGPMEKSEEEYFPGSDQEGGGEEDDGALDVGGHLYLPEEEKHKDIQRDSGGQVCEIHSIMMRISLM